MEQQRTATNEQPERVECPSCLLRLSLLQAQVYKLTKAGKVPHYKPSGKLLFFSKRELDGWLCRNHEIGELACLDEVSEIELKGMSV